MSDYLLRTSGAVTVNVEDARSEGLQLHSKRTGGKEQGKFRISANRHGC